MFAISSVPVPTTIVPEMVLAPPKTKVPVAPAPVLVKVNPFVPTRTALMVAVWLTTLILGAPDPG